MARAIDARRRPEAAPAGRAGRRQRAAASRRRRAVYEAAYNVIATLPVVPPPQMYAARAAGHRHGRQARLGPAATGHEQALRARCCGQARGSRAAIMLHDYHLYWPAEPIRRARPKASLSHFNAHPWPPSSIWLTITPRIREAIAPAAGQRRGRLPDRPIRPQLQRMVSPSADAKVDTTDRRSAGGVRTIRCGRPDQHRRGRHRRVATSRAARDGPTTDGRTRERVIVRVDRSSPRRIPARLPAYEPSSSARRDSPGPR